LTFRVTEPERKIYPEKEARCKNEPDKKKHPPRANTKFKRYLFIHIPYYTPNRRKNQ
jgi:hypothetical protein